MLLEMENINQLLAKVEQRHLWAYFHKDWLLEIRRLLRPQVPANYAVFVESETVLVSPDWDETSPKSLPDLAVIRPIDEPGKGRTQSAVTTAAVIELDEPYEIECHYSLTIRRSPDQQIIGAMEILSPSNKGLGNRLDREKYLHKRDGYTEAGIGFFEIDALRLGDRILPDSLCGLATFERNAWTSFPQDGSRRLRGYGWNTSDPLPVIPWQIEGDLQLIVDLNTAATAAVEFNPWESLARLRQSD